MKSLPRREELIKRRHECIDSKLMRVMGAATRARADAPLKRFLKITRISGALLTLLLLQYIALLATSQKHPILNLQHQQHQSSSGPGQTKPPALERGFEHDSERRQHPRPLDRPALELVGDRSHSNHSDAGSHSIPDGAADWFVMGGGDLSADEGRHRAMFASVGDEPVPMRRRNITSTRRMAELKQRKNGASSGRNKTIAFDDESQSGEASDSNEIYDDADESGASIAGTQKEPECASHGRYYCTFKEDYPLKLVTEVTKYYKWPLEKLFRDLHAQIMPKLAQDSTGNLVCDSITRVVRPGWARNTNERWLVVINTDNYHQYVTEVVCQYGTNSRCNFIPPCYYSSCQQRYNTQKLLVIDPTNPYRGPFLSEFLFPSCCVCYVPSSSDSFKDSYRPSPATIYQRTLQQEAATNLNPPQFRPPSLGLLEEAFSSGSSISGGAATGGGGAGSSSSSGGGGGGGSVQMASGGGGIAAGETRAAAGSSVVASAAANSAMGGPVGGNKAPGPGEIRRAGDQYRRQARQLETSPINPDLHYLAHLAGGNTGGDGGGPGDDEGAHSSFPRLGLADSLLSQKGSESKQQ